MRLKAGQVAVVTGAANGIGFALAEAFAARGLHVVLADVQADSLADAAKTIEAAGGSALGVPTDVRSPAELEDLAAATIEHFGRVDVVCNNAGVVTLGPPTWEIPLNDWDWVLSVNLGGVFNGIRAFVPLLVAQNSGHVVNTASMAGISVAARQAPYLASKHAVVALSEGLADELKIAAPNVGVTVVCPGWIHTNIGATERSRPNELSEPERDMSAAEQQQLASWMSSITGPGMPAKDAAEIVLQAIESNTLHVAPNGLIDGVRVWIDRLLADLGGD